MVIIKRSIYNIYKFFITLVSNVLHNIRMLSVIEHPALRLRSATESQKPHHEKSRSLSGAEMLDFSAKKNVL